MWIYHLLFLHLWFLDTWVISYSVEMFVLLFEHLYAIFFIEHFNSLGYIYLGMDLLDCVIILCLTCEESPDMPTVFTPQFQHLYCEIVEVCSFKIFIEHSLGQSLCWTQKRSLHGAYGVVGRRKAGRQILNDYTDNCLT